LEGKCFVGKKGEKPKRSKIGCRKLAKWGRAPCKGPRKNFKAGGGSTISETRGRRGKA